MKGEAAALSVRAQRCQSHYFSTTPRIKHFTRKPKHVYDKTSQNPLWKNDSFTKMVVGKTEPQHSQCMYNVAMRRVRATTVVVEGNKYYILCECVCVCLCL